MLDRASLERLAQKPEHNDPMLNVALAEEGDLGILIALAECVEVGPEAIETIAARIGREGDALAGVGVDDAGADGGAPPSPVTELDRRLILHPNAPGSVVEEILARHLPDPFFALAAGSHPRATEASMRPSAEWPSASPFHDRPWLDLLHPGCGSPDLLPRWSASELLREAIGRLTTDADVLAQLARDPSRRVRRAIASNPQAGPIRDRLASTDPAAEVRARAARPADPVSFRSFEAALASMEAGGAIGADLRGALLAAGVELDEEGALLGAKFLEQDTVLALVSKATAGEHEIGSAFATGVGVGLGLRPSSTGAEDPGVLTTQIVHLLTRGGGTAPRLTGKARLAQWIAECVARSRTLSAGGLWGELSPGTLASDRMIVARSLARRRTSVDASSLAGHASVPASIVEHAFRNPAVSDEDAVSLAARVAPPLRKDRELPEDELDLVPNARPLAVLERAVLAAIVRAPVSPRAALSAIALDARRSRYVLSAVPTWKGVLTGTRLARVLRSHAGALSAAGKPPAGAHASGARPASVAHWTQRKLSEAEAAVAIAVGDLTATELLARLLRGTLALTDGAYLAAGIEARVAIDGPAPFLPLLDYATDRRTRDASAFSLWMLLEDLDRKRAPSLIASAIDGLSESRAVVPPAACEALAILERRSPGRLDDVYAQSARGRATVASAIARAYRALGGMRDD